MNSSVHRMFGSYVVLCLVVLGFNPSLGTNHGSEDRFETGNFCFDDDKDCFPSQSTILDLGRKLNGNIVLPNMDEYANQSLMYNTIEQRRPSIIVMVKDENDIQHAVLFARKYNLRVTIRSSGHDYMGRSTADGSLNINLSLMKDYTVTLNSARHASGEIKVQTGLTWIEIYRLLDGYDRTIVGGSGKTVTTGGYTLGGGHSPISRSFGYAVDNLLEVQVVLPDGRIATCKETETMIENVNGTSGDTIPNGDLFWALRGGGGGTFGVVVYYVFKLHPAPTSMVVLNTYIPLIINTPGYQADFTDTVFEIVEEFSRLPTKWGGYYIFNNAKVTISKEDTGLPVDLETIGSMALHINKYGPWDGTEMETFKYLTEFCISHEIEFTFKNVSSFLEYAELASDPPTTRVYLTTTLLPSGNQNQEFTDFLKKEMFGVLKDVLFVCTSVMLGGHTKDLSNDSTPLHPGYRTDVTNLACGLVLYEPYDNIIIPLADAFSQRLQEFGYGMYLNEATKNDPNWRENFWGDANYKKLLKIKRQYDPDNFFTCHHCVGSEFTDTSNATSRHVYSYLSFMFAVVLILVWGIL